jgi:hypothetical protein
MVVEDETSQFRPTSILFWAIIETNLQIHGLGALYQGTKSSLPSLVDLVGGMSFHSRVQFAFFVKLVFQILAVVSCTATSTCGQRQDNFSSEIPPCGRILYQVYTSRETSPESPAIPDQKIIRNVVTASGNIVTRTFIGPDAIPIAGFQLRVDCTDKTSVISVVYTRTPNVSEVDKMPTNARIHNGELVWLDPRIIGGTKGRRLLPDRFSGHTAAGDAVYKLAPYAIRREYFNHPRPSSVPGYAICDERTGEQEIGGLRRGGAVATTFSARNRHFSVIESSIAWIHAASNRG